MLFYYKKYAQNSVGSAEQTNQWMFTFYLKESEVRNFFYVTSCDFSWELGLCNWCGLRIFKIIKEDKTPLLKKKKDNRTEELN